MVKEDMVAHKLCAMYERIGKTNRDVFDVQFFLSHDWSVNKKIVEDRHATPADTCYNQIILTSFYH